MTIVKCDMEKINGNKIVKFIYSTGYIQIEAETRDKATVKFEYWISSNTPYRGLTMYGKHHGYNLIFEDVNGDRYIFNGKMYKIDEYENLLEEIK